MSGVSVNLVISNKYAKVELFINTGNQLKNKKIFDFFAKKEISIEERIGLGKLDWIRRDEKITCCIKYEKNNFNAFDISDWESINLFLLETSIKFQKVFKKEIPNFKNSLTQ